LRAARPNHLLPLSLLLSQKTHIISTACGNSIGARFELELSAAGADEGESQNRYSAFGGPSVYHRFQQWKMQRKKF
jgi:hypothetical protein